METISLADFIGKCKNTLNKRPKVKNYTKIKEVLLPGLEKKLNDHGNFDIPLAGLIKVMEN